MMSFVLRLEAPEQHGKGDTAEFFNIGRQSFEDLNELIVTCLVLRESLRTVLCFRRLLHRSILGALNLEVS